MQCPELNPVTCEAEPIRDVPTVSVDRALGHFAYLVDVDTTALHDFYYSLPHKNKPPLANLHIHLSATQLLDDRTENVVTYGVSYKKGTGVDKFDPAPELPPTDSPTIVLFVGSLFADSEHSWVSSDSIREELSSTITHELTHYAQGLHNNTPEPLAARIRLQAELIALHGLLGLLNDKRWRFGGGASLLATELFTDNDLSRSLRLAAGTAIGIHFLGHNSRASKRAHDTSPDRFKAYQERPREEDAIAHETSDTSIVTVKPGIIPGAKINEIKLIRKSGIRASRENAKAKEAHRALSLDSTIKNPNRL